MTNTNIVLNNNNIDNAEVLSIHVTYGANYKFVSQHYVEGKALNEYIENTVAEIRARGWNKVINIVENSDRLVRTDDVKAGRILCYTTNGYEYDVHVV